MHKLYRMWAALVVISLGCFAFFGSMATVKVWKFFSFTQGGKAVVEKLEVASTRSSRFTVEACYTYEVDGKSYQGKSPFEKLQFVSALAAEHHLKRMQDSSWRVYYKKKNPEVSTLDLKFPYKSCLEAAVTLGVSLYFYGARRFVKKLCGI